MEPIGTGYRRSSAKGTGTDRIDGYRYRTKVTDEDAQLLSFGRGCGNGATRRSAPQIAPSTLIGEPLWDRWMLQRARG